MTLRILELSDCHVGHINTKTSHVLTSLRGIFRDTEEFAKLDLIIIAGDFWDRDLSLSKAATREAKTFIYRLLKLCAKYGIVLLVLEGTPSHDWKQSWLFVHLNEYAAIGADVRHVTELCIQRIEKLGIDVLFVPDEWKPTAAETWEDTKDALRNAKLDMVDYAVMHGAFHHQLPKAIQNRSFVHNAENYISIVRKYIFIGHIHLQSQYKTILSAGSTDRIAHGEEAPKGHYLVTVNDDGFDEIVFVENKNAKKYVTIDCTGMDEHQAKEKVYKAVKKLPDGSFVRIKCRFSDVAARLMGTFNVDFIQHTWTMLDVEKRERQRTAEIVDNRRNNGAVQTRVQISKSNIGSLLLPRIAAKYPHLVSRCEERLTEITNG